jgi:membrane protein implicated in regulation of membrane protease activity
MTVRARYFLLQVPGWILVAMVLFGLRGWIGISLGWAVALYAIYVVKDFVLFPFLRSAYDTSTATGIARLVGEVAVVKQTLAPRGLVVIGGELWKAVLAPGQDEVARGRRVRIESARGMVLVVREEEVSPPAAR